VSSSCCCWADIVKEEADLLGYRRGAVVKGDRRPQLKRVEIGMDFLVAAMQWVMSLRPINARMLIC